MIHIITEETSNNRQLYDRRSLPTWWAVTRKIPAVGKAPHSVSENTPAVPLRRPRPDPVFTAIAPRGELSTSHAVIDECDQFAVAEINYDHGSIWRRAIEDADADDA
jgi:hypothetical protein